MAKAKTEKKPAAAAKAAVEEAAPKAPQKPKGPVEVHVVTTPHGEGMRVYGVYSSEKKAEAALAADARNRVEVRVLDGAAE